MKTKHSAGLLLYRFSNLELEVFLVHPGGPFWKGKDVGAWSIPKGEFDPEESAIDAAKREFVEETGFEAPLGALLELRPVKQPSGKVVHAWAIQADIDASRLRSNSFQMEWPPRSGVQCDFPEVDRGEWFRLEAAKEKILVGQKPILETLQFVLKVEDN